MNRLGKALLALVLTVGLTACSGTGATTGKYTAGEYTGKAAGRNGDVEVTVTVTSDKIESVKVTNHQESAGVADPAIEKVPAEIVEKQSTDVDAATGATITSDAIMAAAASALAQASGSKEEAKVNTTADVIVLGAGGAGLSAANAAAENGASVIVLEAAATAGGDTTASGGHMLWLDEEYNATQPRNDDAVKKYLDYNEADFPGKWGEDLVTLKTQVSEYLANGQELGYFDSIERVMVDHYKSGMGKDKDGVAVSLDYELTRLAAENNMETLTLLKENGMEIADKRYKDHANSPVDGGAAVIKALSATIEKKGVEVQYSTRSTELIMDNNKVTGVIATDANGKEVTYTANKGVVIATGGFAANAEMVAKYQNIGDGLSANVGTSNPKTILGDGIVMAEKVGAELRDMQFLCSVLMGYNGGSSISEGSKVYKAGQMVINQEGVRFGDETKIPTGMAINNTGFNAQTDCVGYVIGGDAMVTAINDGNEGFLQDLENRGWVYTGATVEEAAKKAGLDVETVKAEVEKFNGYVEAGTDTDYQRAEFNGKVEGTQIVIAKLQMQYHLTFGGLVTDSETRVLDTKGNAIEGLYAAGDVTSGYEGSVHQSGDCLSVVVFGGQVAGNNVSK